MSNKEQNISPEDKSFNVNQEDLFHQLDVPFNKNKEEIWESLSEKIDGSRSKEQLTKVISLPWFKLSVAAAAMILLGFSVFFRLHSTTINSQRAEQLDHVLPDGSTLNLNAESSFTYHPYWWYVKREVQFEGEGFFKVKKGSSFTVISKIGTTEVLGTSFNINSRNETYTVFCTTGKVKVNANITGDEVILNPNMMAILDHDNKFSVQHINEPDQIYGWTKGTFYFNTLPLTEVIEEVERQYNVTINLNVKHASDSVYTGHFIRPSSVELCLDLICQSFGLTFVKQKTNTYTVSQN